MRNTTQYIVRFVLIMTVLVALVLAGMETSLKPIHTLNESVYNKKSVLLSVASLLDRPVDSYSAQEVQEIFNNDIEELVLDHEGNVLEGISVDDINLADELKKPEDQQRYPLYIYEKDGKKYYILSMRGNGLWDVIWGNVALQEDLTTIEGVSFDHAGETPGLGAEIKDNPAFGEQFIGKKIYSDDGQFTSIQVVKGIIRDPSHQVDGVSGSTITSQGVEAMLYKGIKNYEAYFDKIRKS